MLNRMFLDPIISTFHSQNWQRSPSQSMRNEGTSIGLLSWAEMGRRFVSAIFLLLHRFFHDVRFSVVKWQTIYSHNRFIWWRISNGDQSIRMTLSISLRHSDFLDHPTDRRVIVRPLHLIFSHRITRSFPCLTTYTESIRSTRRPPGPNNCPEPLPSFRLPATNQSCCRSSRPLYHSIIIRIRDVA